MPNLLSNPAFIPMLITLIVGLVTVPVYQAFKKLLLPTATPTWLHRALVTAVALGLTVAVNHGVQLSSADPSLIGPDDIGAILSALIALGLKGMRKYSLLKKAVDTDSVAP